MPEWDIKIGGRVKNGSLILAHKKMWSIGSVGSDEGDGGYVLCYTDGRNVQPFVIWDVRYKDGETFTGRYFESVVKAADEFAKRTNDNNYLIEHGG